MALADGQAWHWGYPQPDTLISRDTNELIFGEGLSGCLQNESARQILDNRDAFQLKLHLAHSANIPVDTGGSERDA